MNFRSNLIPPSAIPLGAIGYSSPVKYFPRRRETPKKPINEGSNNKPGVAKKSFVEGFVSNFLPAQAFRGVSDHFNKTYNDKLRAQRRAAAQAKDPKVTLAFNALIDSTPVWIPVIHAGCIKTQPRIVPKENRPFRKLEEYDQHIRLSSLDSNSCYSSSNYPCNYIPSNSPNNRLCTTNNYPVQLAKHDNGNPGPSQPYQGQESYFGSSSQNFLGASKFGGQDHGPGRRGLGRSCHNNPDGISANQSGPYHQPCTQFHSNVPCSNPCVWQNAENRNFSPSSFQWPPLRTGNYYTPQNGILNHEAEADFGPQEFYQGSLGSNYMSDIDMGEQSWFQGLAYFPQPRQSSHMLTPVRPQKYNPGFNYDPSYKYRYNYYDSKEFIDALTEDSPDVAGVEAPRCINGDVEKLRPLASSNVRLQSCASHIDASLGGSQPPSLNQSPLFRLSSCF